MIDIALSNYNSQGIQKILEEEQEYLQFFLHIDFRGGYYKPVQELVGLILSEHFNIAQAE